MDCFFRGALLIQQRVAGVKKGTESEPLPPKPPVLMTQKFALPRPAKSKIREASGTCCPSAQCVNASLDISTIELAKSLNVQPDPPTPSPRTALFRKRKFEQFSDSDTDDEEGIDCRSAPPVGRADAVRGEQVYGEKTVESLDSLFDDGSVGAYPEMSGALQGGEGSEDDLHLYSEGSCY